MVTRSASDITLRLEGRYGVKETVEYSRVPINRRGGGHIQKIRFFHQLPLIKNPHFKKMVSENFSKLSQFA